jgi:hypothetical protein
MVEEVTSEHEAGSTGKSIEGAGNHVRNDECA